MALLDRLPVGKIVGVAVGDIGQIALLRRQPHGIHGTAARVPSARGLADNLGMQADRLGDLGALVFGHVLVLDPFSPWLAISTQRASSRRVARARGQGPSPRRRR